MATMKAVRLHAIGDLRCDEVEIPVPQGEELLIKVGACGICGSDLPRVFEHGTSSGIYPLTIGHEFAGEVVAVGEKADPKLIGVQGAIFPLIPCRQCDPCRMGHYAQCEHYDYLGSRRDGGFAEYCLIPSAWHLIPAYTAKMMTLGMTEPACVAQHAVRCAGVSAGDLVVIFGAGPIGIMAARWVRIFGGRSLLVDIADQKVEYARSVGMDAIHSGKESVTEAIRSRNFGKLADCAIEGTGASSAFVSCIECVRPQGSIALLGNPMGTTSMPLAVHSQLLRKELTLRGVWNSSRAPWPVDEWEFTVRMMDEGKFICWDLITDTLSLEELPQAIADIRNGSRKIVKAMVTP